MQQKVKWDHLNWITNLTQKTTHFPITNIHGDIWDQEPPLPLRTKELATLKLIVTVRFFIIEKISSLLLLYLVVMDPSLLFGKPAPAELFDKESRAKLFSEKASQGKPSQDFCFQN